MRNEKGSPIQAKDVNGKGIYEYNALPNPKICSSDFWEQRGGQVSFGNLQDDFYEQVAFIANKNSFELKKFKRVSSGCGVSAP